MDAPWYLKACWQAQVNKHMVISMEGGQHFGIINGK